MSDEIAETNEATVPFLRAVGLHKRFGSVQAVNDASFTADKGEIVGLLGPNGAGKTTSFYMVAGLIRPDSGQIFLNQQEISRRPIHRRARLGLGYLAQEPSVFRRLTVSENLQVALAQQPLTMMEKRHRLRELLSRHNLWNIRRQLGQALSGGQRRRTEIARMLAGRPGILLMDEPFAGVDPVSVDELKEIIRQLRDDGMGILITDHNARDMLDICDRSYILSEGGVIASGSAEHIIKNEDVRERYLGRNFTL